MRVVGSVKQDHIVEAAIKRFSYFGIGKTSIAEIADDLGISKPALFYYFHDKSSLLEAVGRKIINEFLNGYEEALSSAKSVEEGLLQFIDVRREFFKKYLLLAVQAGSLEMNKLSPQLQEVIVDAHKKTVLLISNLLQRGIHRNALKPLDVEETSVILIATMEAFEFSMKCKNALLEIKDIDALFDKQKAVVHMLLNGLKSNEWKN